jgi:lipopolysaccharide export system permease protein
VEPGQAPLTLPGKPSPSVRAYRNPLFPNCRQQLPSGLYDAAVWPFTRRHLLAKSLVRELVAPLLLGASATTFLLLVRALFILADLFVSHDVTVVTAVRLMVLFLPNVVSLTLPIGMLFAVLVVVGRSSADLELVALQACGVPLRRAARPVVAVAAVVCACTLILTLFVTPRANRDFADTTRRVSLSAVAAAVEPKVFIEDFPGYLLYVQNVDKPANRWRGVLLFDLHDATEDNLTTADSGQLVVNPRDGSALLHLQDTVTHLVRPDQPTSYRRNANDDLTQSLRPPGKDRGQSQLTFGVRDTDTSELLRRLRTPSGQETVESRRQAGFELHKRVAIPFAALAFAVVAFPLGIRNRKGSRSFGLTFSVGLVVAYYVLLNNGEVLADGGQVPIVVGAWLANATLLVLGLALFRGLSRGVAARAGEPWPRRLLGYLKQVLATGARLLPWRPGLAGADSRELAEPVASNRNRARRMNLTLGIIDGYVIRQCLLYLLLVVATVCALWIVVDLSENLNSFRRNAAPLTVGITYYVLTLPQIIHDILPVAFLIAFLATAAGLDRQNESTALKAAGVSLARVALPLIALAGVCGVGLFLMDENVTQSSNKARQRVFDVLQGRREARSYRSVERPWLFLPDGRTLVNYLEYDVEAKALVRPSIYVFDSRLNLRERYVAKRAVLRDGRWVGEGVWSRALLPDGRAMFTPPGLEPVNLPLQADADYFAREYHKPSQMSFGELRTYVETLRKAGYRVDRFSVQLHQKLAYPLSTALLTWLAMPFAFRVGTRGALGGVALALGLGMAFYAVLAFSTRLGESGLIPPVLASWTPAVVFALLAVNRQTTLRT